MPPPHCAVPLPSPLGDPLPPRCCCLTYYACSEAGHRVKEGQRVRGSDQQAAHLREERTNRGAGGLEGRGSGLGAAMSRLHTCTDRDGGGSERVWDRHEPASTIHCPPPLNTPYYPTPAQACILHLSPAAATQRARVPLSRRPGARVCPRIAAPTQACDPRGVGGGGEGEKEEGAGISRE